MKTRKQAITRIFSFLLAFMMVLTMMPFNVFAEEEPIVEQIWRVTTEDREEKEFPKKDDSVEWVTSDFEIANNKIISFSSQGYDKFNQNPENVVVKLPNKNKDGTDINIIGKDAFNYNNGKFKHRMQFVEFPKNLTNIEEYAFYYQDLNFEEFTVPNTWKEVNLNAFYGAYFKKLILTDINKDGKNIYWQGITTPYVEMNGIGEYTLNSSVNVGFFENSNIKHINYGDSKIKLNNRSFAYINNYVYNKNNNYKTFKITWNGQKTPADFELPPWEKEIHTECFYNCNIQSVYLSNHQNLEEINNCAFYNTPLYEVIIENSPKLKLIRYYYVFYSPNTLRKVRLKNLKSFEFVFMTSL